MVVTNDGGVIIGYNIYNYDYITKNKSQYDFWVIKADSLGEIEWEKRIGDPYVNDYEVKIAETDDGYFLTGYKKVVGKDMLYGYLQKIDFKGNLLWQKPYEQNKFFNALLGIKRSFDGNFYLWGGTRESALCGNEDCSRARIIKIDNKGNTVFDRKYFVGFSPTGIAYNEFSDLEELPSGDLIVCGASSETMYNNDGGLIIKLNSNGDSLWSRIYDRNAINGIDDFYGVTLCKDGGFLFTGNTLDTTGYSIGEWPVYKAWLMKTDSFGCLVPGCDLGTPIHEIINTDYSIKLFPNPSSTIIKIDITIPQYDPTIKTEVVVVDFSGAIVMRYVMPDFAYIAELDISKLPSGVYGVQLRQPQMSGTRVLATEKLVVIE